MISIYNFCLNVMEIMEILTLGSLFFVSFLFLDNNIGVIATDHIV